MIEVIHEIIYFLPQSYVRSGWVNLHHAALRYAGLNSYAWSGLGHPETGTYNLYLNDHEVSLAVHYNRDYAFPVQDFCFSLYYPMCGAGI